MAIINVPTGGQARALHVQQIIRWLRGLESEPVSLTGLDSTSAYALTAANGGVGGKGLAVKNRNKTITLLDVVEAGVIIRPSAIDAIPFRIRNFADSADIFSVDADGTVDIGGLDVVTVTGTQTLTNKTMTAPVLSTPTIPTYMELINTTTPSAPSAGRIRVYEVGDAIKVFNSSSVESTLATLLGTESMSNKTISSSNLVAPTITNGAIIIQGTAPGSPSANQINVFSLTGEGVLKHKNSAGTVKELVDTDSTQTLSNKTFNINSAYVGLNFAASPGGTASVNRIWTDGSNVYYTTPAGTIVTLLSSSNTPTVAALSLARSVLTGAIG